MRHVARGSILPPDQHDAIWAVQERLDFPRDVFGVELAPEGHYYAGVPSRRPFRCGLNLSSVISDCKLMSNNTQLKYSGYRTTILNNRVIRMAIWHIS
jgi:hypothetical protein